eukprot:Pgem_evm1s11634
MMTVQSPEDSQLLLSELSELKLDNHKNHSELTTTTAIATTAATIATVSPAPATTTTTTTITPPPTAATPPTATSSITTAAESQSKVENVNYELEILKNSLKHQVEYYFSRQNLAQDAYLLSQMDSNMYVSIYVICNFKK